MLALFAHNMQAQTYTMTGGTVNTCSGTFLDPGGAGNYANSISVTQTFCSNNGLPIYLQFTSFATEAGFDFVSIYDGPTTGSPQIGPTYAGGNSPGTVTATGTCITIRFTTDGSVVAAGWSAGIGCGTPPPPPPAPAGATCANPNSFCGNPITYPAGTNNGTAPAGPAYGCLGSQPNPAWFNMQVSQTGPMNFSLSAGADIDYIIWGPFTGPTTGCMAGLSAGNIVSCSYSASSVEAPSVPNAVAGQWYMLLITNFSNQPVTISFNQTGGSGQANCSILCNITNMTGTAGACNPANNTFTATGTITTTSPPAGGTLTLTSSCGGAPVVMNPPFGTSLNYSVPGLPTGGASCTITATFSADPTCTRTVTVVPPPPCTSCSVTAANSGPYCPGASIALTAGTATVVPTSTLTTTYSWAGPNGYTGTGQTPAVIPSATAAMAGIYTVTATTGTTTCTGITTVVINPTPTVTVNSPTICTGATANLSAFGAGGGGTYTWSPATTPATGANVTVTPTVTTIYTVTGTSASTCSATATSTVTVNNAPNVTVTSDTICIGGTANLTANGGISYTWSAGTSPAAGPIVTASPAVTTTYVVTVTDANSCSGTATATVTVNPLPIVTVTSATVCATFPATLTASGADTYSWSAGTTPATGSTVTATPALTQAYTVTGTDTNGCVNTATATVTVNAAPIVTVPSQTICINASTPLTAAGANTYTWSPGATLDATTGTTVNANPLVTTTYTIIGTDGNGCVDTTTTMVTVNPLPIVDAGIQDTVCLGNNTILNASGAMTYLWTADPTLNDNTLASPTSTPVATITYTVTGTDVNGCVNTDDVTVIVPPAFTVATNTIPVACYGGNTGIATVAPTPAAGGGPFAVYTYQWQTGSNASIVPNLAANTYTVEVRDLSGCLQTATATVTQPAAPLTVVQSVVVPATCNGDMDGSATIVANGGTPAYTYAWAPTGGSAATTSPLAAGTYTVTVTDNNLCSTPLTVTIAQPQPILLNSSAGVTICVSNNTTLSANAVGGNGGYTFDWQPAPNTGQGSGLATVSPTVTTTYTVTVTDINQCVHTNGPITTLVTVNPLLSIDPGVSAPICEGDNVVMNASGDGGNGNHTYIWSPSTGVTPLAGDGSSVRLEPGVTTVYTVNLQDNCGTPNVTTTYTVVVNPTPTLTIQPLSPGCAPLGVSFDGSSVPAAAQCSWNFGDGGSATQCTTTHTYVQDGSYAISYHVVDINGCENTKTTSIVAYPVPEAAFVATPQPTTIIDPVVTFTDITYGNIASHTWIFNDSLNTTSTLEIESKTYLTAGEYLVTLAVETNYGCVDTVTQSVFISDYYALYVPNAFSPDGDDINEEFRATGTGIKALETTIYDRWGTKIFTTGELEKGWNGRNGSNNKVDKGVYIYSITATSFTGEKKQYTGHVTVVR
ncbi:MAG: hypothetical protein K0S33_4080 [Bacteroidetes bacterium]|nr:hypothetical protein [Bacteroidota bacterium]